MRQLIFLMNKSISLILIFLAAATAESTHWQWREIRCKGNPNDKNDQPSSCELQLKEDEHDENPRTVPFNTCFEENVNGEQKNYCDVLCPGADTVYRIYVYPQHHKSCFTHTTYKLERREQNFYMWRSKKCRTADVGFLVRCEFKSARADFMSDQDLFKAARRLS